MNELMLFIYSNTPQEAGGISLLMEKFVLALAIVGMLFLLKRISTSGKITGMPAGRLDTEK